MTNRKSKRHLAIGIASAVVLLLIVLLAFRSFVNVETKDAVVNNFVSYLENGGHSVEIFPVESERGSYFTPFAHGHPWEVLFLDGKDAMRILFMAPDKAQGLIELQDYEIQKHIIIYEGLIVYYVGDNQSPIFALLQKL